MNGKNHHSVINLQYRYSLCEPFREWSLHGLLSRDLRQLHHQGQGQP